MENLKPSEQAVLEAIRQLSHGNVHQIADSAGYARSTVDKALKALSDAGLIVEHDTGADSAEGAPTQWQLADSDDASAPIGSDSETGPDTTHTLDTDEPEDDEPEDDEPEDDEPEDDEPGGPERQAEPARRAGNRRVMQIAGALVAYPEGATAEELNADTDIPENALHRLLTAMVTGGAAVLIPGDEGAPSRWKSGTARAADIDPNPIAPRCEVCQRTLPTDWTPPTADAEPNGGTRKPDHKVLTLAGSMIGYPSGASAAELCTVTGFSPEMVSKCLSAMERAGVAVRTETTHGDSRYLWTIQPGPLHAVDLDPKCTGCHRPLPGSRSSRSTPTGARRPDALPRNVLREATLKFILTRPGIELSPGAIAGALAVELNRDAVSPGAVKNNCVSLAGEGKILQVSSSPWLFSALPTTAEDTGISEDTLPTDDSGHGTEAGGTVESAADDVEDTDE